MKVKDRKSKVHSTSRGWEKALKKRGNKKWTQTNQNTVNTARNKRYYTVSGWPTISYVGIVIGNGGE